MEFQIKINGYISEIKNQSQLKIKSWEKVKTQRKV